MAFSPSPPPPPPTFMSPWPLLLLLLSPGPTEVRRRRRRRRQPSSSFSVFVLYSRAHTQPRFPRAKLPPSLPTSTYLVPRASHGTNGGEGRRGKARELAKREWFGRSVGRSGAPPLLPLPGCLQRRVFSSSSFLHHRVGWGRGGDGRTLILYIHARKAKGREGGRKQ